MLCVTVVVAWYEPLVVVVMLFLSKIVIDRTLYTFYSFVLLFAVVWLLRCFYAVVMSTGPFVSLFLFVVERHIDFLARAGERYLKGLLFAMFLLQCRCNH